MRIRHLLLAAGVALFAAGASAQEPYVSFEHLPNLIKCLPAPPAFDSPEFANDMMRFAWGKQQRQDSVRAEIAKRDAVWSFEALLAEFNEPFGLKISPENTPEIWKLMVTSLTTTDTMRVAPKAFYHRQRPFERFNDKMLTDEESYLRGEGSYPSGHTMRGWTAALLLAEINPAAADTIFARGWMYCDSRVIAGAHWQSDVDASRVGASIAYDALHQSAEFRRQMAKAQAEYRQKTGKNPLAGQFSTLNCRQPAFLKRGDKVALISPSYFTPMENVTKAADVLRSWGLVPVVGPNVGKKFEGQYAGTLDERLSDLRWAFNDPEVKAIICNRGGYGSIQLINELKLNELSARPKWLMGFSDITTLHGLLQNAGVMSIQGTMSSFLAKGGTDQTSTLARDLLMGQVPRYELPAHEQNIPGTAHGVLVGGNLTTFVPNLGTDADASAHDDIILFIEEVEESQHNIDRQLNILRLNGVLDRCRGVVLGEFTDCGSEFEYGSVEAMLHQYFKPLGIPVMCGFPGGHGNVNLPLVFGAPVTLDVRPDGSSLQFDIQGKQTKINNWK